MDNLYDYIIKKINSRVCFREEITDAKDIDTFFKNVSRHRFDRNKKISDFNIINMDKLIIVLYVSFDYENKKTKDNILFLSENYKPILNLTCFKDKKGNLDIYEEEIFLYEDGNLSNILKRKTSKIPEFSDQFITIYSDICNYEKYRSDKYRLLYSRDDLIEFEHGNKKFQSMDFNFQSEYSKFESRLNNMYTVIYGTIDDLLGFCRTDNDVKIYSIKRRPSKKPSFDPKLTEVISFNKSC